MAEGSRRPSHHPVGGRRLNLAYFPAATEIVNKSVRDCRPDAPHLRPHLWGVGAEFDTDVSSPPQGADKSVKLPEGVSPAEAAENPNIKALLQ